jgi:hypothetical protein
MRRTALFLGTGLLLAAPVADAGLHYVSGHATLAAAHRILAERDGLRVGRVAFDFRRNRLDIGDLALATPTATIRIGHLAYAPEEPAFLSLVSSALAQSGDADKPSGVRKPADAGKISAENIVIDSSTATYRIARIDVAGTDLREDDLKDLFDAKNPAPIEARLGKLSAAKIVLSEATVEPKGQPTTATFVYRNVELTDVVKAHVGDGKMSGFTATFTSPDAQTVTASCGPVRAKDYDIAQNVKIMSDTADETEKPQPLYSKLDVENCKFNFANASVEIASLSLVDVKGRPPRLPVAMTAGLFSPDSQDVDDPELTARRRAYLADIYASFEAGGVEASDLRINSTQPDDAPVAASIAKVSLLKFADSKIGEIRFGNMALEAKASRLKLAGAALRGVNLANVGKLLTRSASDPVEPMPVLDQIRIEGLDVDAADSKADGAPHTRFQIAKFDMTGTNAISGIPTQFAMALDHLTADISNINPAEWSDVAGLGYGKLDFSSQLTMHFDPDKQELGLEDFSVTGKQMGTMKLSGQFSNVSTDIFSPDQALAEAALLTSLINRVEIKVENSGLFEKVIAANAKRDGKSPEDVRRTYIAAASIGIPAMLENGPNAKLIGAALAKFMATPKTLHLVAHAPTGLGASDFALIRQPGALLDRLDIEATANE